MTSAPEENSPVPSRVARADDAAPTSDALGDYLMALFWRRPPDSLAERARRRVTVHLMPILFVLYVLAYLDRANVAAAELMMELPPEKLGLGFTREMIGFGAGVFFIGYWILEIPSALSVERWGARWVFCRILVLWGLCATLVGFIGLPIANQAFGVLPKIAVAEASLFQRAAAYFNDLPESAENQFYFFRFMLGFFEGGFFPSVIVYLTFWFRAEDRARAIAGFTSAAPLSIALGLPASSLLLPYNWFGLPGWRWVFIIEGLLPVIAGVAVLFCLPSRPSAAAWMPQDERDWLDAELTQEHARKKAKRGFSITLPQLGMVLLLTVVYFCLNVGVYGLTMFMPAIIKSQVQGISVKTATLLASAPFFLAVVGMSINGWHSDRTGERIWHTAGSLTVVSLGVLSAALLDGVPFLPPAIMLVVVGLCLFGHMPTFWPIPSMFLGAATAASAIGFINMIGNLGGFLGPKLIGKLDDFKTVAVAKADPAADNADKAASIAAGHSGGAEAPTQSFRYGLLCVAPWPFAAAVIIVLVGFFRGSIGSQRPPLPPEAVDSTEWLESG